MKTNRLKKIVAVFCLSAILGASGCASVPQDVIPQGKFSYATELLSTMTDPTNDYNSDLFYVNSLETKMPDPSVIYVDQGEQAGYFYAYGTSDEISGQGYLSWRSKDLSRWECNGVAFYPDASQTWR